jgi:hypothetical protein
MTPAWVGDRARACIIATVVSLSPAACTRHNGDAPQADFFPLHQEDTWVYEVVHPLRNLHSRMTVRVRGERYIGALGQRARLVDESYAGDDPPLFEGYTTKGQVYPIAYYRKNGFLYRALSLEYQGNDLRDVGLGSSEERFLPDGLNKDLSWDSVTTAYDLGGGNGYGVRQTHRARFEASLVEVPAGRFSGCVRVDTVALHSGERNGKFDSDPLVLYYSDWYAPNVGLIRTVQSNRPDGGPPLAQIELLAYDVEGARR